LFSFFGNRTFTRKARLAELRAREGGYHDLQFLKAMPPEDRNRCLELFETSQSQLRQDVYALQCNGFKRDGYFVEFGATNGVNLNNTWLLEKAFGWRGIVAEPARGWQKELAENRDCVIDHRCVWSKTGERLSFTEAPRGENSALSSFVRPRRRLRGQQYDVETVSLNDLLAQHDAPAEIDFASIDTEGSEFDILDAFDFDRWRFNLLCVEHNFAPQRADIKRLMERHGYMRVLEPISRFDDWYVPAP
jgi:FkbM family methyltransferase